MPGDSLVGSLWSGSTQLSKRLSDAEHPRQKHSARSGFIGTWLWLTDYAIGRLIEHEWALRIAASDMLQDCDALVSEEKVVARGRPAGEAG